MWKIAVKVLTIVLLVGALFGGFDAILDAGTTATTLESASPSFGIVTGVAAQTCEDGNSGCDPPPPGGGGG